MSVVVSRSPHVLSRRVGAAARTIVYGALLAAIALAPPLSSSDFQYPGVSNSWVLLVAAALTVIPLVDPARPWSLRHLDLLALVAPAAALAIDRRSLDWPVVLVYPVLAYLCLRMISIARAPGAPQPSAAAVASPSRIRAGWLAAGIVVLVFAHVNAAATSTVRTDSGEGGVQGARRILEDRSPYGVAATLPSSPHGDVYGPALYEAYTPFAALLGRRGAERTAALAFDLLTALLLFLLGKQLRGPALGVLAAYCWLAFPMTFYEDALGFNDGLVAASLVGVLLAASSPVRRGALAAVAGLGKLSPLALIPALAAYRPPTSSRKRRDVVVFGLGFLGMAVIVFAPIVLHTSAGTFLSRTFGFQAWREPSDSLWSALQFGYGAGHPWVASAGRLLHGLLAAFAGTLVILSYRLVRVHTVPSLAAACAAVLIAVQASLGYYSYSYLLWVVPLVLVAILARPMSEGGIRRLPTPAPRSLLARPDRISSA